MKDLQLTDIRTSNQIPSDVKVTSVYRGGFWAFAYFPQYSASIKQGDTSYFRIKDTFGLHLVGAFRADKPLYRGYPGDYIAVGQNGTFSLVKKKTYEAMFAPLKDDNFIKTVNSNSLKDSKYITSIVKNYED